MGKAIQHSVLYLITLLFLVHTFTPHQHQTEGKAAQVCAAHLQLPPTFLNKWIHHFEQHHAEGHLELANPSDFNLEKAPLHHCPVSLMTHHEGPHTSIAAPYYPELVYSSFWFAPDERGPPART